MENKHRKRKRHSEKSETGVAVVGLNTEPNPIVFYAAAPINWNNSSTFSTDCLKSSLLCKDPGKITEAKPTTASNTRSSSTSLLLRRNPAIRTERTTSTRTAKTGDTVIMVEKGEWPVQHCSVVTLLNCKLLHDEKETDWRIGI